MVLLIQAYYYFQHNHLPFMLLFLKNCSFIIILCMKHMKRTEDTVQFLHFTWVTGGRLWPPGVLRKCLCLESFASPPFIIKKRDSRFYLFLFYMFGCFVCMDICASRSAHRGQKRHWTHLTAGLLTCLIISAVPHVAYLVD